MGYRATTESQLEIAAELVADGKQLRVGKLTDHTTEKVRTLCASPDELRARWADAGQRNFSLSASTRERAGVRCRKFELAERGIDFATVAAEAGQPDAEPLNLLCHLAFHAPALTCRQRADRVVGSCQHLNMRPFPVLMPR